MNRPADAHFEIIDPILQRWSPRAFSDRSVAPEAIQQLLEAARWAPSCFNEQPWRFLIATKDEPKEFERMLACLVEGNQVWAKSAPVLMLTFASTKFSRNGHKNRHAWHDVGLAIGQMGIQATTMGLSMHQMAGIQGSKIGEVYRIPGDFEPVTAIALGYLGAPNTLPDHLLEMERGPRRRNLQSEFAFSGNWQEPFKP